MLANHSLDTGVWVPFAAGHSVMEVLHIRTKNRFPLWPPAIGLGAGLIAGATRAATGRLGWTP